MMQFSRICLVPNHYQENKVIMFVCAYPQCQLSRFLCSKCALGPNHKHNQSDNSHILDQGDFQKKIKNNLIQAKDKQQKKKKFDVEKSIVPLKLLIQEIQNLLKNLQNITQFVEQGKLQNMNMNHLENQLLNIQKYGFNQIDDESLNNLINMPEQQQDLDIYKQLEDLANLIIQNALKIKEWRLSEVVINQKSLSQKIKDANHQIRQIDDTGDKCILTGAISNDLKYIASGGQDELIKIWDYQSNQLIKSIQLNIYVSSYVSSCRFTEDSTLLYAGSNKYLYQFDVKNQFKELHKQEIHTHFIYNIYCISNSIILTVSYDKTIIKTDINKKQQLLKIQAHKDRICGLDYNKNQNIIASGSNDKSIKLWNGNDGSLIIENNNDQKIYQVLFNINDNQLLSLDLDQCLKIWNINYQTIQLEQLQLIKDSGYNISLVLQQQYIIATGKKFIKVYSIEGEFVKQFYHELDDFLFFQTVQHDSMKAVLIKGRYKLQVCKLEMD